ncbi:hypothetical protein GUITHDRAFT_105452 [Guillardia theta CCMP2712]|uniref:Uncharacterized protein n=1 Tax=Guillardia theta (strain CCMP2712) TaxID=905079 RepID=L1JJZ1_GUITC|nr:hypothetical protein GUITHDRAFT_105452 [Guillardia theta CCMP2712]EKX48828.1 hypothetical protein GUITHDRAFT_105452 [Guillardia theta CCMP2712]|eukprot:XP_005835808.1 hypothetical protein GUITHDRAFT_105452 [Guillardia theta CCMP2712]
MHASQDTDPMLDVDILVLPDLKSNSDVSKSPSQLATELLDLTRDTNSSLYQKRICSKCTRASLRTLYEFFNRLKSTIQQLQARTR